MGKLIPSHLQGHLAMLFFSALVAGAFSLGVKAADHIAPTALNAVRFWIAASIIGALALATGQMKRDAFKAPWRFFVLGGLFVIYFVLMFEGLKTADPVAASAVFTLTPIMSGLIGWVLLKQIMTPRIAAALAIGGAGAVWVIFRADISRVMTFEIGTGEVIYFWGCVSHAIYTPMVRYLNRGESAVTFTFGMLVAGGIILTIWGWGDIMATDWANLPAIVWITLIYVSVFASAASFLTLQFAVMRLPSSKVMAYTYLTPSWVILWEMALNGTFPPVAVVGGIGLTILALLLLLQE